MTTFRQQRAWQHAMWGVVLALLAGFPWGAASLHAYSGGWGERWNEGGGRGWYVARWGSPVGGYPADLVSRLQARIDELESRMQGMHAHRGVWDTYTWQGRWGTDEEVRGVEVATCDPTDVVERRATFCGRVDVGDARYVDVWFEFAREGRATQYTSRLRFDDTDREDTFEATAYDLTPGDEYWVRAVGRDAYGNSYVGDRLTFTTDERSSSYRGDPDLTTDTPYSVTDDSARFSGSLAMRGGDDGTAFFLYGTDEDDLRDAVRGADTYADIDESGVEKVRVATGLDYNERESYEYRANDLDNDTTYYVAFGLAYDDEDGDARVELGTIRRFTTRD